MTIQEHAELKGLYVSNRQAKTILDNFASYQRNVREVDVETIQQRTLLNDNDIKSVLRTIENLGYGRYIPGRRGHSNRFQFDERMPISILGQTAAESTNIVESINETEDTRTISRDYLFHLREGFDLPLRLPRDITKEEQERLINFIKSIQTQL